MKKIYITGTPGTGKSTIVKEFNKRGIFAFDIDEVEGLCSWVDKKTQKKIIEHIPTKCWLKAHDWICDTDKLKKILDKQKGTVIVTDISGNQDDYLKLFDKVFLLKCDENTFLKRLENRHLKGENNFGKNPEERDYILSWYKDFEEKMINKGVIQINTEASIDATVDEILSKIKI
jgi:broad-specificity NMP kinase